MSRNRLLTSAALALAGALGVGMAQAREVDVQWSIMIGTPVYAQPMPVYTRPLPVYTRPVPVRIHPGPVHREVVYVRASGWDRDGDGIPNRRDRLYNPQWDRDGDGIPNRRDRYDNARHDRDRDGIPNRHDRYDARQWRGR